MRRRSKAILGLLLLGTVGLLVWLSLGLWEQDPRNPVQWDSNGGLVYTHHLYIWQQPGEQTSYILDGRDCAGLEDVVAGIQKLMSDKPFPMIQVHAGPAAWARGSGEGQQVIRNLGERCRKIGFINMTFEYDMEERPFVNALPPREAL